MEQTIILQGITVDQLLTRIDEIIENKVNRIIQHTEKANQIRYLTRKEVAAFLNITLPTLHDWTKEGLLRSYKIGNRVFYKNNEVHESLRERKFKKYIPPFNSGSF